MPKVEIKPLLLAQIDLPDSHPEGPGTDVIYGFLVRDGPDCVLVDTGVGTGSALIERLYKPNRVELEAAIVAAGESIDQVTAVVNSHLHFDHCGNNSLFPDVPIFVQQAELDASRQLHYTVAKWVDFPHANYVPVSGDQLITANLQLLHTPGHTPGHQSLMIRSGKHVAIIVAQATYSAAEFERFVSHGVKPTNAADRLAVDAYLESNATWSETAYLSSVNVLRRSRPNQAFFSHDSVAWERAVQKDDSPGQ